MRIGIRNWLERAALLALCCAAPFAARADDAKMIFLEYRLVAFGLAADSFPAQPKKLWRVADSHLRLEEVTNPETGTQRLVVVAEPDIWVIDRNSGRGRHEVDPGPTFSVKFPVFSADARDEILQLEMGSEAEFFRDHGAKELGDKTVAEVECTASQIEFAGRQVTLYRRKSDGLPFQVSVLVADRALAVRYEHYERGLEVDKDKFVPPQGVQLDEAKKP
jgi:hypothetical protein